MLGAGREVSSSPLPCGWHNATSATDECFEPYCEQVHRGTWGTRGEPEPHRGGNACGARRSIESLTRRQRAMAEVLYGTIVTAAEARQLLSSRNSDASAVSSAQASK